MTKKTKIIAVVVGILIVAAILYICFFRARTYELGDFGVSISVPASFKEMETKGDTNLLHLKDEGKDIILNVVALPRNFWSSDNMSSVMDEYITLISASKYDKNILDVQADNLVINATEIGRVGMTTEGRNNSARTITFLTHQNQGNLAIEVYGNVESVKANTDMINNIGKSIKIGVNKHDYSNFTVVSRNLGVSGDSGDSGD
jgi:hypothetical protein